MGSEQSKILSLNDEIWIHSFLGSQRPCYTKWPVDFFFFNVCCPLKKYLVAPHCLKGRVQIASQFLLLPILCHRFSSMNLLLGPGPGPKFPFSAWFIPAFLFLIILRAIWKVKRLIKEPNLSTIQRTGKITQLYLN